jgi:hypothetical protein
MLIIINIVIIIIIIIIIIKNMITLGNKRMKIFLNNYLMST